ncbi:MAG TPA: radical SAM family heme chaperone HemW [Dehalococcoidia bacterium]|nr:radical SAM family heme chaperone HemW [Dehalococcoidia bacterium]
MSNDAPVSLYLHVPFCSLKCSYCDFNSYAKLDDLVPDFVDALSSELALWGSHVASRPVPTVFFGGGTPSLLPLPHIEGIMAGLREHFALTDDAEISLEANPGTADRDYFEGIVAAGVNRLSLGFQSMHDDELAALDRIHNSAEAVQCYRWAREAGFRRINIDLIYGLSEQPMSAWQETVERAIELAPDHISAYALTVEDGTKLAYDIGHGTVAAPDADLQADMYEWAQKRFAEAGYQQYEISNWSRPGEECRHNLVYWRNGEWLGLGPGAHGHWGGFRFADAYSPRQYVRLVAETQAIEAVGPPADVLAAMKQVIFIDPQPDDLQMADTAILALRLNEGLDLADFEARFGRRFEDVYAPVLTEATADGMLERANGRIRLTDRGRYLANEVFLRLLPD